MNTYFFLFRKIFTNQQSVQDMQCKGYPITYAMMVQVLQDACPLDEFFQQFAEMQNVMKIFAIVTDPSYHDNKGTEN